MTDAADLGVRWTDERRRLCDLLAERSTEMAGFYRAAVEAAEAPGRVGQERVRRSMIGHCMRELFNNLPEALNDIEGLPGRGRNSDKLTADLLKAMRAVSFDNLSTIETEVGALVTVDADFVTAARAYADDSEAVKGRVKQRDSAVVLGRVEDANPAVRPWTTAREFFMRITHVDVAPHDDPRTQAFEADMQVQFEHVESALLARLGDFFDSFHQLDDILTAANAVGDGGAA